MSKTNDWKKLLDDVKIAHIKYIEAMVAYNELVFEARPTANPVPIVLKWISATTKKRKRR